MELDYTKPKCARCNKACDPHEDYCHSCAQSLAQWADRWFPRLCAMNRELMDENAIQRARIVELNSDHDNLILTINSYRDLVATLEHERAELKADLKTAQTLARELQARFEMLEVAMSEEEGRKKMDALDIKAEQEKSTLDLVHELGNRVYMAMNGGAR